jgi:hypothetical protein
MSLGKMASRVDLAVASEHRNKALRCRDSLTERSFWRSRVDVMYNILIQGIDF